MLFKKSNNPAISIIVSTSLLTLLSSCGNASLENLVGADPELKNQAKQVSNQTKPKPSQPANSSSAISQSQAENARQNSSNTSKAQKSTDDKAPQESQENEVSPLLLNFPDTFPVYPQAELQEAETDKDKDKNSGTLIWRTTDNRKAVADYYQAELLANDWDIIKPFTLNPQQKIARAIAVKQDLRVELSLTSLANQQKSNGQKTRLAIVYSPLEQDIPKSSISKSESNNSQAVDAPRSVKPSESSESKISARNSNDGEVRRDRAETSKGKTSNQQYFHSDKADFADLDRVPEQLQQPLESVAALGILTPYTGKANVEVSKFAPNEIITRGEYARWLIAANNRYYADNPGKKIYIAAKTNQPAFKDVKPDNPDFAAIQSLAEAGLIPSRLTDDSTNLLFRPKAPLTREDLITWKVPLDMRQSLPKASIKAIEDSWGFQDATDIDSSAIRALYADFQNGDRSNVRRMFGYTTLFQPDKPVARAEAAASLWYFGYQGDGVTAQEVLDSEAKTDS